MTNQVELKMTKVENYYGNGPARRYDIIVNGKHVASGSIKAKPFAPWTSLTIGGEVYNSFKSRTALEAHFAQ